MPSRRLFAVTAAVCATAVALAAVAAVRPSPGRQPVSPAAALPAAVSPTAPSPQEGQSPPVALSHAAELDPALAAAALLAVRIGAGAGVYVDTAAVEAAHVDEDATIVTVRALLLRRVAGGWSDPEPARYAVPIGWTDGGPVALATPWQVAVADPTPPQPRWQAVDDGELRRRAAAALAAAGYSAVADVTVRRAAELPGVLGVVTSAVAPGQRDPGTHELWLTEDASGVLGMPAHTNLPVPGERP